MKWHHYLACFFAGAFLANAVPHLVNGISGNGFPTPFASPPGRGLSSPVVNVFWAWISIVAAYLLMKAGKLSNVNRWTIVSFIIGAALISFILAYFFNEKMPPPPALAVEIK